MSLLASRLDRSAATVLPGRVRRLLAEDGDQLIRHYLRLDGETRRARFGGTVGPDFLRAYARNALGEDAVILGLFLDGTLRGVAELRFADGSREAAEAAFSLEREWQGRGHGARLFARLLATAFGLGIRRIVFQCLRENAAMQAIARRHGAVLAFHADEVTAELIRSPVDAAGTAAAAGRGLRRLAEGAGVELAGAA